ncbi:MAG: hypothetical protein WBA99_16975 [Nodosilinea sp.]
MGAISLGWGLLGGCAGRVDRTVEPSPDAAIPIQSIALVADPADAVVGASRTLQTQARRLMVPTDPVAVDLYTLDNRCENYRREPILVPRLQSMETTVGLILAEQAIPDFTLSGYRTSFDPETKTVTIDLRVARTSRRVLNSLSLCEQKGLLGSLRETLINQPDWKIKAVRFTNRGTPLGL